MIHLRQAVVVEGKYDKMRLSALVDGPILVTNGFRIFKNREQTALLRRLAQGDGILILTEAGGTYRIEGDLYIFGSGEVMKL